jgi:hypothetical protein
MKRTFLLLFGLTVLSLTGCTDQCKETRTYRRYVPVTFTLREIREGVRTEEARSLEKPGKIYTKGGYLFINELKKAST